jgi:hypothetical protein
MHDGQEVQMICTGCGNKVNDTSTWILQEPRDLRGWRAHLCDDCDEQRELRPVQNRVVLTLRKLVKQTSLVQAPERV